THQIGALWYLGQAARPLVIPVVHTEHSDHMAHSRNWLGKVKAWLRWRKTAPLAARFCCVSDDIASVVLRLHAVPASKVQVVLNGIDLRTYQASSSGPLVRSALGIPAGAMVVGSVGRLVEVKRHDLLLRAFAALHAAKQSVNIWLLLVGDGPERQRLESLAASLGISARTVFAGYQSQPQQFFQAMDLFALTSRHEGLPLVLLEAWASGLAVVASAVGGIPQTVIHGVTGFLFESGNQTALTETLEGLLDSPSWISRLGRQGRTEVERRYSLRRMADDYEADYRSLLHHRAKEHV
ncbi:MAG: glycosyltransferase family 4 protein, partial [Pirellulaceae bacterium]